MTILNERLTFDQARVEVFKEGTESNKNMYMKGIFLQGGIKNHNQRVYPVNEINRAVGSIMEKIQSGQSILGEVDHPEELTINLDRVSHMITEMWMDGPNGIGKLKLLPTPMGKIIEAMLESGVKLGVSSRGSGTVGNSGQVSDFDIVTVDIVAQPSAPNAYPNTIYESVWRNERQGQALYEIAKASQYDDRAKEYLKRDLINLIKSL
jgi:hypothetical protein